MLVGNGKMVKNMQQRLLQFLRKGAKQMKKILLILVTLVGLNAFDCDYALEDKTQTIGKAINLWKNIMSTKESKDRLKYGFDLSLQSLKDSYERTKNQGLKDLLDCHIKIRDEYFKRIDEWK